MSEKIVRMPTLPNTFNNLIEKTVKIETVEPLYVIELLGNLLGVEDYKINKAAFWFLDIIALEVLRYKNCLDDYHRGTLISWLVGEMKLIRDKKLCREDFFKEMRTLFLYIAEKLSNNDRLLHWELLMDTYSKIIENSTTDSTNNNIAYLVASELSEKKLIEENATYISPGNKVSFIGKNSINHNSVTIDLQEKPSRNFKTLSTTESSENDIFADANAIVGSTNLTYPSNVLDIIIEATYDMYANELRYALIYAVFAKPIEAQIVDMPHDFQIPRQIKTTNSKGIFDIQLRERLEKIASETVITNGKKSKGKKITDDTEEEHIINDSDVQIPSTPPSSLMEEEMLINNRRFILPLIEANEAAQIYEMHAGNM